MEALVGNTENRYSIPDANKTMIYVTNEPLMATTNPSNRKSWKRLLRNSWRRYST
jgi:hypothetical protein